MDWYSRLFKNFSHFVVIQTVKGFSIVNEAEVDVFLKLSCFFYDPVEKSNCWQFDLWFLCLSKSSLNIWKFSVHVHLKPSLENFELYFASVWDKCNCAVVWTFFGIALSLGLEWKLTFSSPVATAEFPKFAGILSAALSQHHLSGFGIAQLGILSPPLALFVVMLSKAHLTSHSRMSGSRSVITPSWLSGSWRSFLYSSVYSCHLFLISS